MRIVLFGANDPGRTLNLDEEARCLREAIESGLHGDRVTLSYYVAARPDDLVKYLSREKPDVVHFSGHGSLDGIEMVGDDEQPVIVSGPTLAQVLENRGIKLVVLNCCSSHGILQRIGAAVDAVVGTVADLDDDDAKRFTKAFYRSLADGRAIREAWRDGRDSVCLARGDNVFFCEGNLAYVPVPSCSVKQQATESAQLDVRASFAGGPFGTHLHFDVFNARSSAVYLSEWYAEWAEPTKRYVMSSVCVRGSLPKRLQGQDRYSLLIDLDSDDFDGLAAIGIRGGGGEAYPAGADALVHIRYEAAQWRRLHPDAGSEVPDDQLKGANITVVAAVEKDAAGHPVLAVSLTNKSTIAIPVKGAALSWSYTPPRVRPLTPGRPAGIQEVAEAGGQLTMPSRSSLKMPVLPGETVTFTVDHELGEILCQLLLGDVRDDDIVIDIYTGTKMGWRANGEEIPTVVRSFAQAVIDGRGCRGR